MSEEEKYSFIIEFDEMTDKQTNKLTDYFNNNEIKFHVLKSNYELKKQKEVIDKAIELLGNYKHYSTPDEKQNGDNEDLVNNAFDILKEVSE